MEKLNELADFLDLQINRLNQIKSNNKMKTIKFRQPIRDRDGKFIEWFYWGFIDGDFITPALQSNGLDTRPESQQFTGILDKNGKEIYGGDLYRVAKNHTYLIKYFEESENNYEKAYCCFCLTIPDRITIPFDEYSIKHGEVIGNIHQNPELL